MAITNYVATATPVAGGEQVTGYVVYDGTATKAYIIPSTATIAVAEGTGVATITPASPTDIVEVTPDTVRITGNIQSAKTISELTADSGTITPDEGYDGLASVTIQAVKLQNVTATSTLSASAGSTPLNKTDDTAWGIGTVTVNNIVTEEASFTPDDAGKEVVPTTGQVLSKVTVAPVPIAGGNSATPSLVQQTPSASGGYWKTFTVNATPLQDAGTIAPTESEQNAPELTGGNIGYSTFKVGAIQTEIATVKSGASETTKNPTEGHYFSSVTVQALNLQDKSITPSESSQPVTADESYDGLGTVTVGAIQIDSTNNSYTPTVEGDTLTPTAGQYFKEFTVAPAPLAEATTITPNGETQTATLGEGNIGIKGVTVNPVPLDTSFNKTFNGSKEAQTRQVAEGQYINGTITVNGYTLNLQEKTVDPEEAEVDVEADSSYDGLSKVTINPIQTESKTITATKEEQVVSPTSGKYLKSVTVSGYTLNLHEVEVDELTVGQEITTEPQYDGISKVTINGVKLQDKSVEGSKSQQQVTKDDETAWGLGTVTVGGYTPNLETKTIDELTTETGAIVPGEGYDGIGSLTVSAVKLQNVSVDPTAEGTTAQKTDETAWGFGTVTVNAPALDEAIEIDPSEEQQVKTPTGLGYKGVTVNAIQIDSTNNSATPTLEEQVKNPTEGAYFKQFTVAGAPMSDALNITPSETQQDFTPSGTLGYKGATVQAIKIATNNSATPTLEQQIISPDGGGYFKQFTVEATPLAEAQTFTPNDEVQTATLGEGNIGIKGATVNAVPVDSTTNTYTPTAEGATVDATEGQYFKSFTVEPVPTQEKSAVPADEAQEIIPDEGYFLSKVTVQADIDAPLQAKTVTPTASQQVVTPDAGYGGLSSVTVAGAPLDEAITVQSGTEDVQHTPTGLGYKGITVTGDADLIADNIKQGVEILGVTGTYHGEASGTEEVGFTIDEWVAFDLPDSITRAENFRYAPYYHDHYLGKTFDGGNYMAITAYSRCGKAIATVMLNDIIGKLFIEKVEIENPFPVVNGVLTLSEDVDSTEIDWETTKEINGNNHTITVSEAMSPADGIDFKAEHVVFDMTAVPENPFVGTSNSITLEDCVASGLTSQALKSHTVTLTECTVHGAGAEDKYLIDAKDSNLVVERSTIQSVNGIRVAGGTTALRANIFMTTGASIDMAGNAEAFNIEGNIFNNLSGTEMKIEDTVTDLNTIHIIGRVEIDGNYEIKGNSVVRKDTDTPAEPSDPNLEIAKAFFEDLDQNAVSDYLVENKDAFITAFGLEGEEDVSAISQQLYDKLQSGGSVVVNMNDGGVITVTGHFDDIEAYWTMNIHYSVPANGTNKCFVSGSGKTVKGGDVTLTATEAEITTIGDYGVCIPVYGYKVSINNVTIEENGESYILKVENLTKPTDWSHPSIIDPDGNTWEIRLYDFQLPPSDAEGTISIDGNPVEWSKVIG